MADRLAWHETLEIHELVAFQSNALMDLKMSVNKIKDAELKKLWNQGMSVYDLAGHFGRKDVDVRTRLGKLGM